MRKKLDLLKYKNVVKLIHKTCYCNDCGTWFHKDDLDEMDPRNNHECLFCYKNNLSIIESRNFPNVSPKAKEAVEFARKTLYEPRYYLA